MAAFRLASPRSHDLRYHRMKSGPRIRCAPRNVNVVVATTRVPCSVGWNVIVVVKGAFGDVPFIVARCGGSYAVVTASFATVRPNIRITARRVEPTPWGGGEVQCSSTSAGNQRPVCSTSVRTAKTSSIGRAIEMELTTSDIGPYFAYSTARVSRMTVTLIWPG